MFCKFHEVSRNSPAIAANFVELAGHFNPQKTIGTCSDHP